MSLPGKCCKSSRKLCYLKLCFPISVIFIYFLHDNLWNYNLKSYLVEKESKVYELVDFGKKHLGLHEAQQVPLLTLSERTKLNTSLHCEVIFLGCFPKLQLKATPETSLSMTRTQCHSTCSSKKSMYAGLHQGKNCFCVATISGYTKPLGEKECKVPCPGNGNETCGGETGIQWYRMKSPCVKGSEVSKSFEESRFIGCFVDDATTQVKSNKFSFRMQSDAETIPPSTCILKCGAERYPLAYVDVISSICICGRFTKEFNWSRRIETCNDKSLRIHRTFAEDERCEPLKFLPSNSTVKKSVLLSFPGSGNTWARHMIEQASGIYTGSVYTDLPLFRSGLLGEKDAEGGKKFVFKDHMFGNSMSKYHSAVFLIRNPYDAHVAEFNRDRTGSHTGHASKEAFLSEKFRSGIMGTSYRSKWAALFDYVVDSKKPFHLLRYEDLLRDPVNEIRKIVKFLEATNGFKQEKLEEKLLCLSQNLQGGHKRKKNANAVDPFTNELITKINSLIDSAEKKLASVGKKVDFSSYERSLA